MIRVLQVYKDFFPPRPGGIERNIAEICRALDGHVEVRALVSSGTFRTTRDRRRGIDVIGAPEVGRALSVPFNPTLPLWLRRFEADIYHVHSPNPMAEVSWLLARPKGSLVVTYHADVVRQARAFAVYRPFFLRFLTAARRILVTSPGLVDASPILPMFRERCAYVPLGIDLERLRLTPAVEEAARRIRATHGSRLVLFVGRLVYFKGLEWLLRAMPDIDGRLVVIGDGPMRGALEAMTGELGIGGRVIFAGALPDAELTAHLHACDLLALPSSHAAEGFGIVQIEAQACGKPTVCTDVGTGTGFATLDGITGLVVPARDAGALARAVTRLLDDEPLRRRLGEAGRRRVEAEFSQARLRERLLAVYSEALNGAGRSRPC